MQTQTALHDAPTRGYVVQIHSIGKYFYTMNNAVLIAAIGGASLFAISFIISYIQSK